MSWAPPTTSPSVEVDTTTTLRRIVLEELILDKIEIAVPVSGGCETHLYLRGRSGGTHAVTVPDVMPDDVHTGMRFRVVLEPIREEDK